MKKKGEEIEALRRRIGQLEVEIAKLRAERSAPVYQSIYLPVTTPISTPSPYQPSWESPVITCAHPNAPTFGRNGTGHIVNG